MTFRAPLVWTPNPPNRPQHDVGSYNLALQTATPRPFIQGDWQQQERKKPVDHVLAPPNVLARMYRTMPFPGIFVAQQSGQNGAQTDIPTRALSLFVAPGVPFIPVDGASLVRQARSQQPDVFPDLLLTTLQPAGGTPFMPIETAPNTRAVLPNVQPDIFPNLVLNPAGTVIPFGGHFLKRGQKDEEERKRYRRKDERRQEDVERAFNALLGSPEPEVVQQALEIIAQPRAESPAVEALSLEQSDRLLAFFAEVEEAEEFEELQEILQIIN